MYLVFDVETTGLPLKTKGYPDPTILSAYDSSRLVQMTFATLSQDFQIQLLQDYIIRTDGFPVNASEIHGITLERSLIEGSDIKMVLQQFHKALQQVEYVISHNYEFDSHILCSEAMRYGMIDLYETFIKKPYYCTMKASINLCRLPFPTKEHENKVPRKESIRRTPRSESRDNYKYPKLAELYRYLFSTEPENCHNSKYDVIHTIRCFKNLVEKNIIQI